MTFFLGNPRYIGPPFKNPGHAPDTSERFCTMYEKCNFLSMGYISALTQASVSDLKVQEKKPIIYLIQSDIVWDEKLCCEDLTCMQIFVI